MAVRIQIIDTHGDLARFAAKMALVGGKGPGGLESRSTGSFVKSIRNLQSEVGESALRTLPRTGGWEQSPGQALASRVARSRYQVGRSRSKGRVVFQATNDYNIRGIDEGVVRHPVFGKANIPRVRQSVRPGWFTRPVEKKGPAVRRELINVMELIKREFERL